MRLNSSCNKRQNIPTSENTEFHRPLILAERLFDIKKNDNAILLACPWIENITFCKYFISGETKGKEPL